MFEGRNLTVGYGDVLALRGVDVSVSPGTIHAILGRNGAGKSTLLLALAGMLRLKSGEVSLDGASVTRRPAHQRNRAGVALVLEGKRIFRQRTVLENLIIGGRATLKKRELAAAADEAMDRFPVLRRKRDLIAGTLSGGEQQMLAISQALMPRPRYLLLDEPSAGLTPEIVQTVFRTIVDLRESGLGVLVVEQIAHEAMKVAQHVSVLDLGRIVLSGRPEEVAGTDVLEQVYLGSI